MAKESASKGGNEKPAEKKIKVFVPVESQLVIPIRAMPGVTMIQNKKSALAIAKIADGQQGRAKGPKAPKNPVEHFRAAMHLMPGAKAADPKPDLGFPASGFRWALVNSAPWCGLTMKTVKGAVFIIGDSGSDLVRLGYKKIVMREDGKRNANGNLDLRYRPELFDWSANVTVRFDRSLITEEQIYNLLHRAGYSIGIADERPQKGGNYGRFELNIAAQTKSKIS